MTTLAWALLAAVVLLAVGLVILAVRIASRPSDAGEAAFRQGLEAAVQKSVMDAVETLRGGIETRLKSQETTWAGHLKDATEHIQGIAEKVAVVDVMSRQVAQFNDLLKPPKIRGGIGEVLLKNLLEEMVPAHYITQHQFQDGTLVDAVVQLPAGFLPVDSKFPMESFQRLAEDESTRREFARAVRGHVDKVAKYIKPAERTVDLAFMYIPVESVYYEILRDGGEGPQEGLFRYAIDKRVVPVSPLSFYAHLVALAAGFQGLRIEQKAREIQKQLQQLTGDLAGILSEDFRKIRGHLEDAMKSYDKTQQGLDRLKIHLETAGETPRLGEGAPALPPTGEP